jgi:hypothetical protein
LVTALAVGLTTRPTQAQINVGSGVVIDSIDLEGVAYDAVSGLLTATGGTVTGTIAGLPFTTEIDEFTIDLLPEDDPSGACSVLHLELAPIDIDLLGLHVDTSAICLNITAIPGGGLLGDLLCSVAGGNLLDLNGLLDGLTGVLETALNDQVGTAQEGEEICDGECEILDLALGPVDLNLLGLRVQLDNCEGGPVQVCVSATAGAGLLGDLLCGLAGGDILPDLGAIEDLLGALSGILGQLEGLDARPQDVNRLTGQLARDLADGELSDKELDKLVKQITKLLR